MINAMIQKVPKIPKGLMSPEGERYVGGLLENIQEKFDIVMEHLGFVEKRTNSLEKRMDRAEIRLDNTELKLMDKE